MAKFRKKQIVIDAWLWDETKETFNALKEAGIQAVLYDSHQLSIETLEGTMVADKGDWIVKGIKGEFYPCKPDIFLASYDSEEEDTELTGEWLESIGFLQDGDDEKNKEYGRRAWSLTQTEDDDTSNMIQVLVSAKDHSVWLEVYDPNGQSLTLIEVPGGTRERVLKLCEALGIKTETPKDVCRKSFELIPNDDGTWDVVIDDPDFEGVNELQSTSLGNALAFIQATVG